MRHLFIYIKSAALAAVVALGAASCADFLEIEPRDIVTEDNFWNEKADIDQMVAGCYASMQSEDFINRCIVWGELRSDNIYPGANVENDHYDLYQALRENLLSSPSGAASTPSSTSATPSSAWHLSSARKTPHTARAT